jgi:tetratricopeptide (TPR) repeat protein/transglutaminase-like putative cysteine protease
MSSQFWLPFFLLTSASALGQTQGNQKPLPTAAPDFSKEAYVIERISTRITAEDDGTSMREVVAEVKMLGDAGVKAFAVLDFVYTSDNEEVQIDSVRVHKPDGTVVKTPDYNIQDMPGEVTRIAPLYSDIHEKHVAVKGLDVGDVLEYLVRYRTAKPLVPGQFWREYSFTKDAIAKDEEFEISVPAAKYVKVVCPEFKPEIKEEGGRRIYRWTHANLQIKEKDPNEPPRRIPPNPDVQITTFRSWEEVGRWYGDLQKTQVDVTPAIQSKADELTKGLTSDDDKIHAIYNFVSLKYHYIGLDFGIGRYQPHAADDVLDNGYGDCKDKHTLLTALLKAIGVEAWPVLIHTSRKLDPDVPSPGQFNHVITVVPRGNKLLWLDTTPEVAPYGLLLLTLRDKQALMIPTNKPPVLVSTPRDAPFPQEQDFTADGKLSADGTFTGHIQQKYRGDSEVVMRTVFRQVPESQWKEGMQRFSYALNFAGDVSNVKVSPPDDLDKPFELSYDYVRKDFSDWEHHQITPPLPPVGIEIAKAAKDIKPQDPVLLGGIGKLVYRARIELPSGYSPGLPADCHLIERFAEYNSQSRLEKGVVTTIREVVLKQQEVPLGDWERFYNFGRGMSDDESNYITLSKEGGSAAVSASGFGGKNESGGLDTTFRQAWSVLQQRDFKRAEEMYRNIIAQSPKYKFAHLCLGYALRSQNRREEALREFRQEEEISPEDLRAYQGAAAVLFSLGTVDDVIAEWRKLLKVDPANRSAMDAILHLLIQHQRYAEAGDLLEGALQSTPDNAELQFQLGTVYLKTGETERAVTHMKAAVAQKDSDPMMFNNVAYALAEKEVSLDLAQQYAKQAVQAVEAQSADEKAAPEVRLRATYQLSLVWDTLGWIYFSEGDMSSAESYVRSAWVLGQDGEVGEHLGDIYEKEHKNQAAAEQYKLSLAAIGSLPPNFDWRRQNDVVGAPLPVSEEFSRRESLRSEITARYQKLTGKKPEVSEIWRLPNGQWTKSTGEELVQMRTAKLGKPGNLSGSAEFQVVFAPAGVESVELVSGPDSLKPLGEKIKAAHYAVQFPEGSQAKLFRRAALNCSAISGCMAVLLPVKMLNTGPNPTQ